MLSFQVEFTFKQGFGKPGEQIVSIAENEKASLLMIGSRGHGWLARTILGSVSNYVIHHTSIPVLICKDYEKMEWRPSISSLCVLHEYILCKIATKPNQQNVQFVEIMWFVKFLTSLFNIVSYVRPGVFLKVSDVF